MIFEQGVGEGIGMLRDCHKVLGCSYYFSRVSQETGSWSSSLGILGNDPRRREHLITMHPMSQKYLARKKCNRHCTKSQASSGHIRSSSDKLQVLPSQLGWSVNSFVILGLPSVLPQLLSSCQGHAPDIYKQN